MKGRTLMTCGQQRFLRDFEATSDRRVWCNDTVVPHDCETQFFAAAVIDEIVLLVAPSFADDQRILQPRLFANDGLEECLDSIKRVAERSQDRKYRVGAFKRAS